MDDLKHIFLESSRGLQPRCDSRNMLSGLWQMFKLGKKIQRINLGSIVSPSMIPSQEQVSYSSRSPNDIMASTMLLVTVCVFSQSELSIWRKDIPSDEIL